ncbi:MAG TPA: UrcA family protein [Caulobacteraceae bacterium]|jgi:UrcA family protein|nr:UrcA family protein [Caulobacteraceae bacterium]
MTKFHKVCSLILALASSSAMVVASPVCAQSDMETTSVTVRYGDLDVEHSDGAKVLLERIRFASIRACGGEPDVRDPHRRGAYDECRDTAVRDAVAHVHSPVLTAMAGEEAIERLASR